MEDFKKYLNQRKISFSDQDLRDNNDYLRASIRKEVAAARWGGEEGFKIFAEIDPQVQKALESFPQAQQLARLSAGASSSSSDSQQKP